MSVLERQIDHMVYERLIKGLIFQIDKLYLNGKVQECIFAVMRDEDYPQNPDKQTKVYDLEKQIAQMVYKLYNLTPEEIAIVEGKGQ